MRAFPTVLKKLIDLAEDKELKESLNKVMVDASFSEMEKMVFAMQAKGQPVPMDGKDPFPSKYGRPFTESEKHWYRNLFGNIK